MLIALSLKLLYSTMCGKNFHIFQIYGVHNPRKCIDSRYFHSCLTRPPLPWLVRSCHNALCIRKLLIPPGRILSKICLPQQQKEVEKSIICFIKIQSENMKMTWGISFFIFWMICNFFKRDGFTVLIYLSII